MTAERARERDAYCVAAPSGHLPPANPVESKKMSAPVAQSTVNIIKCECRDQVLKRVVVFNDRAEVKRLVECKLEPGLNEVHIENVTQRILDDSVRVDGHGDGVIHEVQLRDKPAVQEETDSPKVAALRAKFDEKSKEVNSLEDRQTILERRVEVLDEIVGEVGKNAVKPPGEASQSFALNAEALANLSNFYSFYEENSMTLRTEKRNVDQNLEKAKRELSALKAELRIAKAENSAHYSKSIIITLESEKGGHVKLEVNYQVHGASWSPSYDIRVDTRGQQPSLRITYSGKISQTTREDWSDALLVLSTAQPCLGGNIPELAVLEAILYRPPPPPVPAPTSLQRGGAMRHMMLRKSAAPRTTSSSSAEEECGASLDMAAMAPRMAEVAPTGQHALSTEFVIAKPAAIPSDGAEHKVTIGIVDLSPQMVHQCVPSKNASAFLTALAVNNSKLPFLPGDATVYLNNSFVSKTSLKSVSPGEKFFCSLGVDTALRIEYKPVKKYHEEVGYINKNSSTVYEQVIVVKNSRSDAALITVKQQVPRSTDEKIKVRLINPTVSTSEETSSSDLTAAAELPKKGAKMKGGILEWTVSVPSGIANELHVKWAVEHPVGETIEFVERQ
ncbi:unnamed protein product [Cylicocyclus nassatus]|uniref:Protein F37C4.5 n=1 Tax=Cylicocyclus nassatus TaxID=53992 RepID=A0AA36DQB8_CYLNA|nr:unnamed protein product [Cylicocyclus nassatus]